MAALGALTIPASLKDRIDAQARRDYPLETCGLLLGREEKAGLFVEQLHEARNSNSTRPQRFYEIDRLTYDAAERLAADAGLRVLGIYHTHPDAPAVPSEADGDYAFPDWAYWITPVDDGHPGEARIWYRQWSPLEWRELDLTVVEEPHAST